MTRDAIIEEVQEVSADLLAFKRSRDEIQRRINSLEGTARQDRFVEWAATQVILNGLILAITRCEGLLDDYKSILGQLDVPDNVFKLKRNS